MKNKILLIVSIFIGIISNLFPQSLYRSGMFLHHSVGNNIWGPNGSNTSIPHEIDLYNGSKGFTGTNMVSLNEEYFPVTPTTSNEWWEWHKIFDNEDTNNNISPYLLNNKIIIIKSCYPSSDMSEGWGSPADTIYYDWKSVEVYKWHWRSIIRIMEQHPENFFVLWTNAPKVIGLTNSGDALRSYQFSTWAKDTLAAGLDTTYGAFPPNVYVFDIFNKLTNSDHYLDPAYAVSSNDNHPNSAATELLAPQFVNEIFDAAITYESIIPVELTLFSGYYEDGAVNLTWVTASEINNFGFEVEKRNDNSTYESIGFINGNGTSTNRVTYNFIDENLASNKYYYRLKQIDLDGTFEYSNEIEIDIDDLSSYQLYQNYPNPFNPSTEIFYVLAKSGNITLKVYDSLGSEVVTLVDGYVDSGKHSAKFNAKVFTTGIYFYKLKTDNFTSTRKMLLIK